MLLLWGGGWGGYRLVIESFKAAGETIGCRMEKKNNTSRVVVVGVVIVV